MPLPPPDINRIAQQYSLSIEAVEHLLAALRQGHYQEARFNHPELGGRGQWSAGQVVLYDATDPIFIEKLARLANDLLQMRP